MINQPVSTELVVDLIEVSAVSKIASNYSPGSIRGSDTLICVPYSIVAADPSLQKKVISKTVA